MITAALMRRGLEIFFAIIGEPLSNEDKAELRESLTEKNIDSLCDILDACECEGIFETAS